MATARGTTRVGVRTRPPTPVVQEIVPNSGWSEDSTGHYLLVDLPVETGITSDFFPLHLASSEFRIEEVTLQVDSYGRIVVKGERQVNEWKSVQFRLNFPEPVDSDMDKIAGKFDGGILYVTVPKRVAQQNKESEAVNIQVKRADNDSHQTGNGQVRRAEENDSHQQGNGKVGRTEDNDRHAPNANVGRIDPSQYNNHAEQEVKRNENEHIGDFPEQVIRNWDQESMLKTAAGILRKNKGIVITAIIAFSLGLLVSRKSLDMNP
ncbi:hypothetical protein Fmac_026325 [Flemingia macrophylla]|uniref:SHSP domain-containing protein n=1 Tax=Flemingia macrophylla TaxID=520843 RepID=A0ABD1LEP0_9FABA